MQLHMFWTRRSHCIILSQESVVRSATTDFFRHSIVSKYAVTQFMGNEITCVNQQSWCTLGPVSTGMGDLHQPPPLTQPGHPSTMSTFPFLLGWRWMQRLVCQPTVSAEAQLLRHGPLYSTGVCANCLCTINQSIRTIQSGLCGENHCKDHYRRK